MNKLIFLILSILLSYIKSAKNPFESDRAKISCTRLSYGYWDCTFTQDQVVVMWLLLIVTWGPNLQDVRILEQVEIEKNYLNILFKKNMNYMINKKKNKEK